MSAVSPVDGKAGDARLVGEDLTSHLRHVEGGGGAGLGIVRVGVLVVDVVAYAAEFGVFVRGGY